MTQRYRPHDDDDWEIEKTMTRTEEQTLQALIIQFGAIATGMVALQQEVAALRTVVNSIVPASRRPETADE